MASWGEEGFTSELEMLLARDFANNIYGQNAFLSAEEEGRHIHMKHTQERLRQIERSRVYLTSHMTDATEQKLRGKR